MKAVCSCGLLLRVTGDSEEIEMLLGTNSDWAQARHPCPECHKSMVLADAVDGIKSLRIVDVTPQEAFTAVNGLGLPSEHDCGETAVRELFKLPVVSVAVHQIPGSNRSLVESIEFEGGQKLYLASGAQGATVYRISGTRRIAEETMEELCPEST